MAREGLDGVEFRDSSQKELEPGEHFPPKPTDHKMQNSHTLCKTSWILWPGWDSTILLLRNLLTQFPLSLLTFVPYWEESLMLYVRKSSVKE